MPKKPTKNEYEIIETQEQIRDRIRLIELLRKYGVEVNSCSPSPFHTAIEIIYNPEAKNAIRKSYKRIEKLRERFYGRSDYNRILKHHHQKKQELREWIYNNKILKAMKVTQEVKNNIWEFFRTQENNSVKAIAMHYKVSEYVVHKEINQKLAEQHAKKI